jgi:hypothetical protein
MPQPLPTAASHAMLPPAVGAVGGSNEGGVAGVCVYVYVCVCVCVCVCNLQVACMLYTYASTGVTGREKVCVYVYRYMYVYELQIYVCIGATGRKQVPRMFITHTHTSTID